MSLTRTQRDQFANALLESFDSHDALRQLVAFHLSASLDVIAGRGSLRELVPTLIQWVLDNGKGQELVAGAYAEHASHSDIQRLHSDAATWVWDTPRFAGYLNQAPWPEAFVQRGKEYGELRDLLLAQGQASVGLTGVHGAGGYGKTTLAQAVCHDRDVMDRYADGVLWVELGEKPDDIVRRLLDLVEAFEHRRPGYTTSDAARTAFGEALGSKSVLLILDDAWDEEHVRPFLHEGPNCLRLITTRKSEVLPPDARSVNVDEMTEEESIAVLGAGLEGAQRSAVVTLAERLGHWPFLLRPANSALLAYAQPRTGNGMSVADALAQIDAQLTYRGLEVFTKPGQERNRKRAVSACIGVSLDLLSRADQARFADLAVFPEDTDVPFAAVEKLWELPTPLILHLCQTLGNLSLFQRLDLVGRTLRLHDVMRTFLCERQPDLPALHSRLLDAYALDDWAKLPANESYLWDHLAYHLAAAGRHFDLRNLFMDDRWLQARVDQDGYAYDGYIADLNIARKQADDEAHAQIQAGGSVPALAESIHYALIGTSINSLSANYEPAFVARATKTGLWSAERALSVALKVPDSQRRAVFLTLLLRSGALDARQRQRAAAAAHTAAEEMEDEKERAGALAALAPQLTGAQKERALEGGLAAAEAMGDESQRSRVLAALAPQLSGALLERALALAEAIRVERSRAEALAALAPQLSGAPLERALALAEAMGGESQRSRVLAALAPQLSGALLERALAAAEAMGDLGSLARALAMGDWESRARALAAAEAMGDLGSRARALAALARQLRGAARERALERALTAAEAMRDLGSRAGALAALAPQLRGAARERALERALVATRAIRNERSRADVLTALAPQLSGAARQQALERALAAAEAIRVERSRAEALAALAPQLSGAQKERALEGGLAAAAAIPDEKLRADALAALAPQLSGVQKERELERGLAAAAMGDENERARALAALAPQLSGALLERGLAAARAMGDEKERVRALAALAPQLRGARRKRTLKRALAAAGEMGDEKERARALAALAPQLRGALLERALTAAEAIRSEWRRAQVLAALASQLSGEARTRALERELAAAEAMVDSGAQARVLTALAPQLSGALLKRALAAAEATWKERQRSLARARASGRQKRSRGARLNRARAAAEARRDEEALAAALAPQLRGARRKRTLKRALAAAMAMGDEWAPATALAALAPHLSGAQKEQALARGLAAAETIGNEWARATALAALALHLSGEARERAVTRGLAAAEAIRHERKRAEALAALAPRLSGALLERGLAAAKQIGASHYRAKALVAFLPVVTEAALIVREARSDLNEWLFADAPKLDRANLLGKLSDPTLFAPPIFDQESLDAIAQSIMDICWEWRWL